MLLYVMAAAIIVGCDNHPSYKTPSEAVEACQKELVRLKKQKDMSIEQLSKATSYWLEIQDSSYSVFEKDTSINLKSPVALAYFVISDSIREQINRLAFSQPRTLHDVMYLKLNTANGREKVVRTEAYKDAVKFYKGLDNQRLYPNLLTTINAYDNMFQEKDDFKNIEDLLSFIAEEDRCFRSLLKFLSQVSTSDLQRLTNATANAFDNLYESIGVNTNNANDRAMLFLTMRFNRRVVQNALACQDDIKNNKRLDKTQRANYRWMLIQPYISIDDYSTKVLTDDQKEHLLKLAKELPQLLAKLEYTKQTEQQNKEFNVVLSNYFLKTYLSTSI
mgnify:FL=1